MYLTRHSDIIKDVNLDSNIVIIGAGSIGSYATLALAKLGFKNITVMDDGIIEEENIAPQFFRIRDIGKAKVTVLKESIRMQTGVDIIAVPHRWVSDGTMGTNLTGSVQVLICAVDSMQARSELVDNFGALYFIDARMAIQFLTVMSYKKTAANSTKYRKTLFTDDQAVQEACTNKAISFTSLIAGGMVAKTVLDCLKGSADKFRTINFDIDAFDMVRM